MPILNADTRRRITALLLPLMGSENERRALLDALFTGATARPDIDPSGAPATATRRIITQLHQFGDVEPDQPALWLLLQSVRAQVGVDKQAAIDDLCETLLREADTLTVGYEIVAADGTHIFISYSRANQDFVRQLTGDMQTAGVNIWLDKIGLKTGNPDWEQALRDAIHEADGVVLVASPDSRRSRYVRDELAIAEMERKPVYPVWAEGDHWIDSIPMGKGYTQFTDMRGDAYRAGLAELLEVLGSESLPDDAPVVEPDRKPPPPPDFEPRNPYKGLKAFRAEDRADFFGRDTMITALVDALRAHPAFLAVVGPSGSGKSSVVMAGLTPALRDGAIAGSDGWTYLAPLVPGTHPLENLTIALSRAMPEKSQRAIREDLDDPTTRGLLNLAKQLADTRLVLYIDQFEELFTLVRDEPERQQFIDLLTTAATEPGTPVTIILSMRADFYDRPMSYSDLGALIEAHNKSVLPMTLADLTDVVQRPAEADDVHLTFEPGLAADIVFAVRSHDDTELGARDQATALPLLQFTLDLLFQGRDGLTLTRAAYDAMGGVRGALARHAEDTYTALSPEQQRMARALFLRLIEPGATEQDTTRRRASRDELTLADADQTAIMRQTAKTFTDARLLVSDTDTIEVAHEALIREWARLGDWLDNARDDLRLQKTLNAGAAEWVRRGRNPNDDRLYRGELLGEAQAWAGRSTPSADEAAFIAASADAQQTALEREAQRQRALRYTRVAAVSILVVALVGGLAGALLALDNIGQQRDRAEENLLNAWDTQALFLADLSRQEMEAGRTQNAVNLAMESLANYPTIFNSESRDALHTALTNPVQEQVVLAHDGAVRGASWNADETHVLTWSDDNTARVWDLVDPDTPLILPHDDDVWGASWNADGTHVLTWSLDDTARVWDLADPDNPLILPHDDRVGGASWNADETRVLTWSWDDTARVWDLSDPDTPLILPHDGGVNGASWSADETHVLTWSGNVGEEGSAHVWDLADPDTPLILKHDSAVGGANWNADGTHVLTASIDGRARVWDLADPDTPLILPHDADVNGASWNADGTHVLTWSFGSARVWNLADPGTPLILPHDGWVWGASWNADETHVLTWSSDDTARVWDLAEPDTPLILPHDNRVNGASWNADETHVLTASTDNTARVWDLAHPDTPLILPHDERVWGASWNGDETRVLIWSGGTARVWDLVDPDTPLILPHDDAVNGARWNGDETHVLTASTDNTARVWDLAHPNTSLILPHDRGVTSARWNGDETHVLTASSDGTARVWDLADPDTPLILPHDNRVNGASWNADETHVLTWSGNFGDGSAHVWDLADLDRPLILSHDDWVNGASWNADETLVLTWSWDDTARVWDLAEPDTPLILPHVDWVNGASWNADETQVLTWSDDGSARVWDLADPDTPLILPHDGGVSGASWNADETHMLTWSSDGSARVWDLAEPDTPLILPHDDRVSGASWNTDETHVLTWSSDDTARVWDLAEPDTPLILPHVDWVNGASWNADETHVLTWSQDGTARVWDLADPDNPLILPHDTVRGASWNADGTHVLTWSDDGTARVWTVNMPDLIAMGQAQAAVRPLSNAQREQFFLPTLTPTPSPTATP